ncbi:MAG: hypothetical protein NTX03_07525 [Bacteroidetes bacterium]|nr:hypothetical protein [Bacteroidota bacterium]
MTTFRSLKYPRHNYPFKVLQEYSATPSIILICFLMAYLYVLLARHLPILFPGIMGVFVVTILSSTFGLINAKRAYVEAGIEGRFFYLANANDLIFRREVEYYPASFANVMREGNRILINYKGNFVKLEMAEWQSLNEFLYQLELAAHEGDRDGAPL